MRLCQSHSGQRIWFLGEAVNGLTQLGMFNGAVSAFCLWAVVIRPRLLGVVEGSEYAAPFVEFWDIAVNFDYDGSQTSSCRRCSAGVLEGSS